MRKLQVIAGFILIALVAVACGSSAQEQVTAEPDPTVVQASEPTSTPTVEPAVEPEPTVAAEPTATTEPTATPTATPEPAPTAEPVQLASDEWAGDFECANQEPGAVRQDAALSAELQDLIGPGVPGLVAASVSSDGALLIGAAGNRYVGSDDPLLVTDRMHLGSDTKSMTAALLAVLSEQGELGLDTPITEIWPDAQSDWEGVTMLDLLRHRGGAEDSIGRDQASLWNQMWASTQASYSSTSVERANAAMDERARFATALTSDAPSEPVGNYAYSNAGYILVGAAIESTLGSPWEELMCEHIFKPLRMDGCGFGVPQSPGAQGHSGTADNLVPSDSAAFTSDNPIALGPAGTVHCPIADWARYIAWVLRGAQGTDDLLSAESWERLLEPEGQYASGWGVSSPGWAEGTLFTHAGSNTLWFANAWVAPGLDRAFLVVANAATPQAQQATNTVSTILFESG